MILVVTGAEGFIGRHVCAIASADPSLEVVPLVRSTPPAAFRAALTRADAVIHLAGVNRPEREEEFTEGNEALTQSVTAALAQAGRRARLLLSSSTRAGDDTPYGRSKNAAEDAVRAYAAETGAPVAIYRLPNVFGKWSRPFYNTAIATFCHLIARDEPVEVHEPDRVLTLVYGEDVARDMIARATASSPVSGVESPVVTPAYERRLADIVQLIQQFRAMRTDLVVPNLGDEFTRKLYGTYVSFLPLDDVSYPLRQFQDERGALAELLKSHAFGQVFVSRTRPGITRGNHYHHTKTEKFVVVEGDAVIRMRPIAGGDVTEIAVRGSEFRVVDIPTGYTHSITNVGDRELITLFWASEIFDPERPDTYFLNVQDPR